MEKWILVLFVVFGVWFTFASQVRAENSGCFIKVNQEGYLPGGQKLVVVEVEDQYEIFEIIDIIDNNVVYTGKLSELIHDPNSGKDIQHGDFSDFSTTGRYIIIVPDLGRSYEFAIAEDVYYQTLVNTVRSYSLQRSNTHIDDPVTGLKVNFGHHQDAQALMFFSDEFHRKGDRLDVSGGWYDAGDYGKYIPPAAVSVAQILLAYELNPDVFHTGQMNLPAPISPEDEELPDILVEAKFELEWMEKMQRPDGAVYHKVSGRKWTGFVPPEQDTQARYIYGLSTYGTAQYAAVMAMAARVFQEHNPTFASRMLENAIQAQEYLEQNLQPLFRVDPGQDDGSGGYSKWTDDEERAWALAELFKTTGDQKYHIQLMIKYRNLLTSAPEFISWGNTKALGQWAYYTNPRAETGAQEAIRESYIAFAESQLESIAKDGYRNILESNEYTWASAKNTVAKGNLLLMAFHMEPNMDFLHAALDQLHNVLGRSATGYTYLTGVGTKKPLHLHHRILQSTGVYVPGLMVGGPNKYGGDPELDQYIKEVQPAPAMAYIDHTGSWSSNEYAIDYTAPIVFMLAHFADSRFLQLEVSDESGVMVYEAEEAELSDLHISQSSSGYLGRGYVTGFTNDTGSVTFRVKAPDEALYRLVIGYGAPHGPKDANLFLNGEPFGSVTLPSTPGFDEVLAGNVLLQQGENTITIEKGWGWYDIDYISVEPAALPEIEPVRDQLINQNATRETKALMRFLVDNFGKYVLSGQQEYVNSNYADVNYIFQQTGRKPAILGLDLIDYSPSRVEHGTRSSEIETAIDWKNQGGIVALTWHWNAPTGLGRNGQPWWSGFYTEATTFDVAYALDHPDSEECGLLIRDIDAIAEQLKWLQSAEVPVLWRPLHEAEGGWFWWGAKGPGPAKALWRLLYERLTYHHGLNNLIWVWNSASEAWYPGDEYVDIVSYDVYTQAYDYSPAPKKFASLLELGDVSKVVALGENGAIPDPDLMEAYGAYWSWFITWNGDILRDWTDLEHLIKVYNHPLVLTLDELPDIY